MSKSTAHTLYICYFGLREPLVQTQVLSYLREIKELDGVKASLLTFEPEFKKNWPVTKIADQRKELADEGIEWHCLPYHKRPSVPATVYDIIRGAFLIRRLIKKQEIEILHARIHFPAIMAALARKFSFRKPKLIFDIRGFIPEEYTDAGNWKENGLIFRTVKLIEKWLLKESDAFVVLTEKAREIMFPESVSTGYDKSGRPVEVIPCCVDLERLGPIDPQTRKKMRERLHLQGRKVIIYVGSFGGWYMTGQMLDFFALAKKTDPKYFALVLTQRDTEKVVSEFQSRGFASGDFLVASVTPEEVSDYLSAADLAISFIRACYSKQSSSPTKIAEYLAAGLPIISSKGIGDIDEQITADRTGLLIDDFSSDGYAKGLHGIEALQQESDLMEKCRQSAIDRFDLGKVGGTRYRRLYQRLLNWTAGDEEKRRD